VFSRCSPFAYREPGALLEDLQTVARSLKENFGQQAGFFQVMRFVRRVRPEKRREELT